jgi:hypothetical protein
MLLCIKWSVYNWEGVCTLNFKLFADSSCSETDHGFHQVLLLDKTLEIYELDVEGTTYEPVGKIRVRGGSPICGASVPALRELGKVSS